jgi:hypothetical protein
MPTEAQATLSISEPVNRSCSTSNLASKNEFLDGHFKIKNYNIGYSDHCQGGIDNVRATSANTTLVN